MEQDQRLGVQVNVLGARVPRWQAQVIERIAALEDVSVWVVSAPPVAASRDGKASWLRRRVPALQLVQLPETLMQRTPDAKPPGLVVDLSSCSRARSADVSSSECPQLRLESPDGCLCAACMPFGTAVTHGTPAVQLMLVMILPGSSSPQVIRQGVWRSRPERLAHFVTQTLSDVVGWPADSIQQIVTGRSPAVGSVSRFEPGLQAILGPPTGTIRLLLGVLRGVLRKVGRDLLRHEQWTIGVASAPIARFLDPEFRTRFDWRPERSRRRYLADPFGWMDERGLLVLAEQFDHLKNRGQIVRLRYGGEIGWGEPETWLDLAQHLSYPFLFSWQRERRVVPECFQSGSIRSYSVTEHGGPADPQRLIDGFPAVDATLFEWQSRWWILATSKDAGADSHLYAWHAPVPTGPWQPHSVNPVKIDLGSSRPGGTPFIVDGALFRPAQDCRRTYGARIVINRVLELTPDSFVEQIVGSVEPEADGWWCDGLHTLSAAGDAFTLVDAKREVFSPYALIGTVFRIVRKIFCTIAGCRDDRKG